MRSALAVMQNKSKNTLHFLTKSEISMLTKGPIKLKNHIQSNTRGLVRHESVETEN